MGSSQALRTSRGLHRVAGRVGIATLQSGSLSGLTRASLNGNGTTTNGRDSSGMIGQRLVAQTDLRAGAPCLPGVLMPDQYPMALGSETTVLHPARD